MNRAPWIGICLTLWGTFSFAADIGRSLDPVIIRGESLPALLGKETIGIRLFAYDPDQIPPWRPIPFQIDEVALKSYYTIGNFYLDPIDELVFMAKDLGSRPDGREDWYDEAVANQNPRYEIAVQNPVSGVTGYIYILWSPYMPNSDRTYISYADETIYASSYEAGQDKNLAGGLLTQLSIPVSAGGDGINLMARQRLRIRAKAGYGSYIDKFYLEIQEQWYKKYDLKKSILDLGNLYIDVKHKNFGYKSGPIRVIRTDTLRIHAWGSASIGGLSFNQTFDLPIGYKFYPNYYETPTDSVVVPLEGLTQDGTFSLEETRIQLFSVLNEKALGMRFLTPRFTTDAADQAGLMIDGNTDNTIYDPVSKLSAAEWPGKHWYGISANPNQSSNPIRHATLFTMAVLRGTRPLTDQYIYYADNDVDLNSSGQSVAVYGLTGIQLYRKTNLPSSPVELNLAMRQYVFSQVYGFNELNALFETYKEPLSISILPQKYDTIDPGTIRDLAITGRADSSVTLSWTAVGDDCTTVRAASQYIVRYSVNKPGGNRDWDWWGSAIDVPSVPAPSEPRSPQTMTIFGLVPEKQYYFGIRALDEAGNASPSIAMVTSVTTPVELAAFTAVVQDQKIDLYWRTASESNNYGFALERRYDEEAEWQEVAFIKGHGTTNVAQSYSWSEWTGKPGRIHYRLKQIDTDGSFAFSDPISVVFNAPETWELAQNFPNPFNPSTTIAYQVPASSTGTVELIVYDLLGRRIRRLVQEQARAGYYRLDWDGRDDQGLAASSGVYMYILTAAETRIVRKMIKLQ